MVMNEIKSDSVGISHRDVYGHEEKLSAFVIRGKEKTEGGDTLSALHSCCNHHLPTSVRFTFLSIHTLALPYLLQQPLLPRPLLLDYWPNLLRV